ncbi:PhoH family protein [Parasutterella excrementihominis]|jgi:PhoH-like ATPase|uniref:PhoH family protein n=2 Tax=Parasutterella excrementihominis TaxID=487175 RepID=UPI00242C85DB|nr:PhoH family protein [Parasutterella excrementihominis]MCI9301719.1 PhoH family protein [Parasutterella excrementihominis]
MPLPKAPVAKGSVLTDIPAELPTQAPAPTAARAPRKTKAAAKPAVVAKTLRTKTTVEPISAKEAKQEVKAAAPVETKEVLKETTLAHRRNKNLKHDGKNKLYVLDTNVLLHDPTSIFRFQEHDIYLPMMTLEELDNHKSGMTDVARNARQVSRTLDGILQNLEGPIDKGIPLETLNHGEATGRLFIQTKPFDGKLPMLPQGKADNQILSVVEGLKESVKDRDVVLVSKDINMRLKAAALNLVAEDYYNDKMIEDSDILYSGTLKLPANFWDEHGRNLKSWQKDGRTWYQIEGSLVPSFLVNQFIWYEQEGATPFYAQVMSVEGNRATVRLIDDYLNPKHTVWGINARNREQAFALNLLMDPNIDFVTLLGQAGTGKTLLTLAAGLTQTMEQRRFNEIIITRATISVGEDIGFLPGTEEEKMAPWLGAIDDNLEVLNRGSGNGSDWGRRASEDLIRSRIRIKSMSFMRGRTFLNKFVIIDEAQNLTPKQMKTLITRAGPGTKIVCLGNIAQIDTPYLTEGSSGLTYVVDRFKGWPHSGHITMQRGERSRLADFASDAL